ncbi:MAG TPA: CoA ester lyase [Thermomicrobiaceae bacterium]|nr:CoA ester lyase [Thermomicrobiaceae bacterium]
MPVMRSLLFVPGNRERMIDKALASAADVVLLDLEDSVTPGEKEAARRTVAATLERLAAGASASHPLVYVRVNSGELLRADLDAVARTALDGVVLPKAEAPELVEEVDGLLARLEEARGLAHGTLRLLPIVESARGLLAAPQVAAGSPRVVALMFGGEDFSADLGLPAPREREAAELLYPRWATAVAAAAAGVPAIDTIWADVRDEAGLLAQAQLARRLGYAGKAVIHPGQIAPVNRVFSPTSEEIAHARRVVAAAEEGERAGSGAVALDGRMIDRPIVERARRTLTLARALGLAEASSFPRA